MTPPRRVVLVGHPVAHSLSPLFQNAAIRDAGFPARYEAVDVAADDLDSTLDALLAEGAAGNVTIPHKLAVAGRCAILQPAAARTGAVNTFWVDDHGDGLVGDNTDVDGFDALVRAAHGVVPRRATVGVFGARGAAAAVLAAIERWEGCTALVHNRSPQPAEALCARFRSIARVSGTAELAAESDIVVNATSIGLADHAVPIDPSRLRPGATVVDLVYRRGETAWVRAARDSGRAAMDGLTMLIEQGAHAFTRWFGRPPNREAMWNAVSEWRRASDS